MLTKQFKEDLAAAKEAEQIAKTAIAAAGYKVFDVADQPEFYHKGDLQIQLPTGELRYVEVKDDSRIADTQNILLEEEVYFKDSGRYAKGYMYSDYDIYAVVSKSENTIYFFDFSKLKQIYKQFGIYKRIHHPEQYSDCYLLEMCRAKQFGALIAKIKY